MGGAYDWKETERAQSASHFERKPRRSGAGAEPKCICEE